MCPACIASAAMLVAGSASAGGVAAYVIKKLRGNAQGEVSKAGRAQHD